MGRTLDVRIAALALSFVVAGGLVIRASAAAFSDSTANTGNQFSAGDVVIADDDGGASSMFTMTGIQPGATATKCINVTYSGNLPAEIRLYADETAGDGLADYLDVTVERSTDAAGGVTADCTGFTEAGKSAVWTNGTDGDLGAFLAGNTDYASGADAWAADGSASEEASYKFIVTLQDDNGAQGLSSTVSFTWEAQST